LGLIDGTGHPATRVNTVNVRTAGLVCTTTEEKRFDYDRNSLGEKRKTTLGQDMLNILIGRKMTGNAMQIQWVY